MYIYVFQPSRLPLGSSSHASIIKIIHLNLEPVDQNNLFEPWTNRYANNVHTYTYDMACWQLFSQIKLCMFYSFIWISFFQALLLFIFLFPFNCNNYDLILSVHRKRWYDSEVFWSKVFCLKKDICWSPVLCNRIRGKQKWISR